MKKFSLVVSLLVICFSFSVVSVIAVPSTPFLLTPDTKFSTNIASLDSDSFSAIVANVLSGDISINYFTGDVQSSELKVTILAGRVVYNSTYGYYLAVDGTFKSGTVTHTFSGYKLCDVDGYVYHCSRPIDRNLSSVVTYIDGIEGYIDTVESKLDTIADNLTQDVEGTVYDVAHILTYQVNGVRRTAGYFLSAITNNTGNIKSALETLNGHVDGVEGYIDGIEGKIDTTNGRLSTLSGYLDGVEGYIDQIEGRLIKTASNGTSYTLADLSYNTWQSVNDVEGYIDQIEGRIIKTASNGTSYTLADLSYNIWQRMTDVVTAINNQTLTVDTSGIHVNADVSSLNLWNNKSYCCGYRTDASGSPYSTLDIPYSTATAILERLNTDYVGQAVTVLNRDGTTSIRYLRSASLLEDGIIRVSLTNGYNYFLCDNTNVLYAADMSGSLDYQVNSAVTALGLKLDNINTSINNLELNTNVEVIQNIQDYNEDVDGGIDYMSKILQLVRTFFNPGHAVDWGEARSYAMNWGSD